MKGDTRETSPPLSETSSLHLLDLLLLLLLEIKELGDSILRKTHI